MRDDALARVHPAIATPLAAFDEAGVRWCLLRGAGELHRVAGDVDLLVHRRDLGLVRSRLASMGGFRELRAWGRRPHHFFVAHVACEEAWLKLDIVSELAFGERQELRTGAAEAVLARRIRDGFLARPAPADAFWALLVHVLLDRGEVVPRRGHELVELAAGARMASSPLGTLVEAACPPGWDAQRVLACAAAARFDELLALAPALRARWPGAPRAATEARAHLRGALRRADRARRRLAVLGAQQSGLITSYNRSRSAG
jgi:hypothetical protein